MTRTSRPVLVGRYKFIIHHKKGGRAVRNAYGHTRRTTLNKHCKGILLNQVEAMAGIIFQTSELAQYKLAILWSSLPYCMYR